MVSPEQVTELVANTSSTGSAFTPVVTPEQVSELAGVTVSTTDIARAQLVISTAAGFPLGNAEAFALLPASDQQHLVVAVVWQCVALNRDPASFGGQASNVASASANGASITYRDTGGDGAVAPLAERELAGLSWRSQPVTVRTLRPYTRTSLRRGPAPDPWVTLG